MTLAMSAQPISGKIPIYAEYISLMIDDTITQHRTPQFREALLRPIFQMGCHQQILSPLQLRKALVSSVIWHTNKHLLLS